MDVPFYQIWTSDSPESWHLRILRDELGTEAARYSWRDLTWAKRVNIAAPLHVSITKGGVKDDISFAEGMVPIVSARAKVIRSLADNELELIPSRIQGEIAEYFALNILSVVECLDEAKTQYVEKWTLDSARPDRVGGYKMLWGIAIDSRAAGTHNLFRLGGFRQHIIASFAIKNAFEKEGFTGACFRDVRTPR